MISISHWGMFQVSVLQDFGKRLSDPEFIDALIQLSPIPENMIAKLRAIA